MCKIAPDEFDTLRNSLRLLNADESITRLTAYLALHPDDDRAFLLRGIRHWGAGHRAAAINDYLTALRINPDSPARQAIEASNSILDFYDKNQYNP